MKTNLHIIPFNLDVVVSIRSLLFMLKTQSMENLVNNRTTVNTVRSVQAYLQASKP